MAEFDEKLHARLAGLGVDITIRETPFGLPTTTPFPADREHASYDRVAVERFWHILEWTDEVFEEFAGWYCGKTSPVHLFWHSFDLALTRFGSRRAPAMPDADPVTREAYLTRWSRSASGPVIRTFESRRTTRTPLPSPWAFASKRSAPRRPSGANREAARSRYCATRRCVPPRTRRQRCSPSWRAPIRPVPERPAGIGADSSHPGVQVPQLSDLLRLRATSRSNWRGSRARRQARTDEYEQRVVGLFDQALLDERIR